MTTFNINGLNVGEFPRVCICIPTYNAAATIRETLVSILSQTYSNISIIISDNASTDETLKIVELIADPRVVIHRNSKNIGGERNFTRCIELADGEYTAIFHADDVYESDMVEKQVNFLEKHTEIGAVLTAATRINATGKPFGVIGRFTDEVHEASVLNFKELVKAILRRSNFLICPSAMVRTHIYKAEIFSWRGDLFCSSADLDVWLRIASKHSIAILNEALMRYRVADAQFSSAVRLRTERPDIFLVLEYYLSQDFVKEGLTKLDWLNYRGLEINDYTWRAINLFCAGQVVDAKLILRRVFNMALIPAALFSRRGRLSFCVSCVLFFLIVFKINRLGKIVIEKLRNTSGR
ncbi:MAG: glycosyltransferase [Formivibrio sp.]|nr:glycosyltransferase [Formivibrio sp.]